MRVQWRMQVAPAANGSMMGKQITSRAAWVLVMGSKQVPVETFKEEWRRWIQGPDYRILVLEGVDDLDPIDNNVDVEVHFDDGRRYGATLFTLQNLHSLLESYETTGECGGGAYFWTSQMIIVRSLSPDDIAEAIAALIAEGELDRAFCCYTGDTQADIIAALVAEVEQDQPPAGHTEDTQVENPDR